MEDFQGNCKIPFNENEENMSTISIKATEPNASDDILKIASKTLDVSKTIEQNASKKIKVVTAKDFLTCIDNLLE